MKEVNMKNSLYLNDRQVDKYFELEKRFGLEVANRFAAKVAARKIRASRFFVIVDDENNMVKVAALDNKDYRTHIDNKSYTSKGKGSGKWQDYRTSMHTEAARRKRNILMTDYDQVLNYLRAKLQGHNYSDEDLQKFARTIVEDSKERIAHGVKPLDITHWARTLMTMPGMLIDLNRRKFDERFLPEDEIYDRTVESLDRNMEQLYNGIPKEEYPWNKEDEDEDEEGGAGVKPKRKGTIKRRVAAILRRLRAKRLAALRNRRARKDNTSYRRKIASIIDRIIESKDFSYKKRIASIVDNLIKKQKINKKRATFDPRLITDLNPEKNFGPAPQMAAEKQFKRKPYGTEFADEGSNKRKMPSPNTQDMITKDKREIEKAYTAKATRVASIIDDMLKKNLIKVEDKDKEFERLMGMDIVEIEKIGSYVKKASSNPDTILVNDDMIIDFNKIVGD